MSTILDALRKSEQERRLNSLPRLSDMPAPQEPNPWPKRILIGIIVALVIAAIVVATLWLSSRNKDIESGKTTIELSNDTLSMDSSSSDSEEIEDPTDAKQLVVNVISYSEDERQRFVMINGKLFRQGEFINAGLKIDSISKDSVILNQRGRRLERRP